MLKTRAITRFLSKATSPLAKLYNPEMEVQINVARDDGVRYIGNFEGRQWRGWISPQDDPDDPEEVWKNIRIPIGADTPNPSFKDTNMQYSLAAHAEGIGMTGWNWKHQQTFWVGFDFDSIANHKAGISLDELEQVRKLAEGIPWVEVYSSTSGKGMHLYVFLEEPFKTDTHNEHASVARAVLSLMSAEAGYNFNAAVDCVGSVLWCWHRRQEGTNGLQLMKKRESELPIKKIPRNWREHLSVIKSKGKKKISVPKEQKELIRSLEETRLEPKHKEVMNWFTRKAKHIWWWDTDNFMMVGHTKDFEQAHLDLDLKGLYATDTSESSEYNCFAFPLKGGRWVIRRFSKGVQEHNSWVVDNAGWTKTTLNEVPNFERAMSYYGGNENEKGEFVFSTLVIEGIEKLNSTQAIARALAAIGIEIIIPSDLQRRDVIVKNLKQENKVSVHIDRGDKDQPMEGWINNKSTWLKVFPFIPDESAYELDINADHYVRHCVQEGQDAGWYLKANDRWIPHAREEAKLVLKYIYPDLSTKEVDQHMAKNLISPWLLVDRPFQEEYPNGRQWNKDGAQFSVEPKRGTYDTWVNLFNHVGAGLDPYIKEDPYCKKYGIIDGGDYLFAWVSSLFQKPEEPLPYLFFYGAQKNGKSTWHEALSLLFKEKKGYCLAANALKNTAGFNDELAGSILCIVEEVDLSGRGGKSSYNKIKEWTTAKTLSINTKFKNVYQTKNYTHWCQFANDSGYCISQEGDTRIVFIEVPPLKSEISKDIFMGSLWEESAHFLHALLEYELPPRETRLGLPTIETDMKSFINKTNQDSLSRFIDERCFPIKGTLLTMGEFVNTFHLFLRENNMGHEIKDWNNIRVGLKFKEVEGYVKGRSTQFNNKVCIGNMSFNPEAEAEKHVYVNKDGNLCKQN